MFSITLSTLILMYTQATLSAFAVTQTAPAQTV